MKNRCSEMCAFGDSEGVLTVDMLNSKRFELTEATRNFIMNHVDECIKSSLITDGVPCRCITCGNILSEGTIYVDDDSSGVAACLHCVGPNVWIDHANFRIKISRRK